MEKLEQTLKHTEQLANEAETKYEEVWFKMSCVSIVTRPHNQHGSTTYWV